jgi:hypothetical protein
MVPTVVTWYPDVLVLCSVISCMTLVLTEASCTFYTTPRQKDREGEIRHGVQELNVFRFAYIAMQAHCHDSALVRRLNARQRPPKLCVVTSCTSNHTAMQPNVNIFGFEWYRGWHSAGKLPGERSAGAQLCFPNGQWPGALAALSMTVS